MAALLTRSDPTLSTDRLGILHPPPPDLWPGAYRRDVAEGWGPRVLEGLRP